MRGQSKEAFADLPSSYVWNMLLWGGRKGDSLWPLSKCSQRVLWQLGVMNNAAYMEASVTMECASSDAQIMQATHAKITRPLFPVCPCVRMCWWEKLMVNTVPRASCRSYSSLRRLLSCPTIIAWFQVVSLSLAFWTRAIVPQQRSALLAGYVPSLPIWTHPIPSVFYS